MGGGPQPADRVPLRPRRRRPAAQPRGRARSHGAGPDPGQQHAGDGGAARAAARAADRVRAGDRSGRPRPGVEPGASGRQSHRLHQFRVLDRNQVAGDAQAARAARHAGRAGVQSGHGAVRRPVPATGRGRGAVLRHHLQLGRRARRRRDRARDRRVRARAEWRADGAAGREHHEPSRPDHRAGGAPPPAGGLPVSLLRRERRPALLWLRRARRVSARRRLCRPHPQGRPARASCRCRRRPSTSW